MDSIATQTSVDHLCVLIHGLWGNPQHMSFVAQALREKYPESKLDILISKRNAGNFTYDGIELGGERVTHEIEDRLEELTRSGSTVKKISIIGYSLGGLVARYVIGLLYSGGWFDKLEPMNFTTFATPHLGVRTPQLGVHNDLWNFLGARTLSTSGRQLFTIDSFRDTGRPLLAVLTDPSSIFMRGLALFHNRSLYCNIINDRSSPYYTSAISRVDPYTDLEAVKCNYIPGYDDVILDPTCPVSARVEDEMPNLLERMVGKGQAFASQLPLTLFLSVVIPIGVSAFLLNAGYQSVSSRQRIKLHEAGEAGIGVGNYRIPLLVQDVQSAMEHVYEDFSGGRQNQYLPSSTEDSALQPARSRDTAKELSQIETNEKSSLTESVETGMTMSSEGQLQFPTLALTTDQFEMIDALNALGIQKYPVHIHKHRHSHAAMICRRSGSSFDEGKVVARHWLTNGFEI